MEKDEKKDQSDKQLNERLVSLEARLEKNRQENAKATAPDTGKPGYGNALKMSSEFISAIIVGAMIGYLIDSLANTTPWGMIVMLLLGFVAGVVNVLRSSGDIADPYKAGWAGSSKGTRDQKVADKPSDDLYDDED
ncbi:MAG: AtpZ/AtpI family protein [Salaquimonas sp.]